jgi:hypothetical protein
MEKQNTPTSPPIKVVAGKPLDQYPTPKEMRDLLRHFYHHTGEQGLEVLMEQLPKIPLIYVYREAVDILQHWDEAPQPPAGPCARKEVAHG